MAETLLAEILKGDIGHGRESGHIDIDGFFFPVLIQVVIYIANPGADNNQIRPAHFLNKFV